MWASVEAKAFTMRIASIFCLVGPSLPWRSIILSLFHFLF
jgi:hypothetical protein